MRNAALILTATAALGLVSCAGGDAVTTAPGGGSANATLADNQGRERARALLTQTGDGVRLSLTATGMTPGAYGAHVHTVGRCDAPDFASAGPHWNPSSRQHGTQNPQGPHLGDLPNLLVGTDGRGTLEVTIAASLASGPSPILDGDGAAVVIHAAADDYRTDPSGNSGARIACGILG